MGGVTGGLVTLTTVELLVGGQPPGILVTVTVYVPLSAGDEFGISGFGSDEVNPFVLVHE
jgi:hypothetical protein